MEKTYDQRENLYEEKNKVSLGECFGGVKGCDCATRRRAEDFVDGPILERKYVVYAIGEHGDGFVQKIGEYDDPEEIEIHVGHFSDDVVISIERE